MIIAVEGIDAAGKHSASTTLVQYLQDNNRSAKLLAFPRYEGPVGDIIKRVLTDDLVPRIVLPGKAKILQSLMLADRLSAIDELTDTQNIVVCDRYYMSGIVYGIVEGLDEPWLYNMHKVLPQANMQILLDIDPLESSKRRAKPRDANEADLDKLKKIREKYLEIWKGRAFDEPGCWFVIDASQPVEIVNTKIIEAWQRHNLIKAYYMNLYTEYP